MSPYFYSKASAPSVDAIRDRSPYPSPPPPPLQTEQPPPPYSTIAPPPPPTLPQVNTSSLPPPPSTSYGALMPTYGATATTATTTDNNRNYIANLASLRTEPGIVQCPECGNQVETVTVYKTGSATVFSALLLLVFGCHGTCIIPFFCPLCKDVTHKCPACDNTIATYSRMSQNVMLGES